MTNPQILAYNTTGAVAAPNSSPAFFDWTRNQLYLITGGSASNAGLHQYEAYPSGDETRARTISQLGITEIHASGSTITQGGYLIGNEFNSNSTTLWEVYGPTLSLANQFGVPSSSLSPSTISRILTPGSQARLRWGNVDYIMSCPLASGFGEICVLSIPGLYNNNLGAISESRGFCGPGAVGPTSGTGFVLGAGGATDLSLYRVNVSVLGSGMTFVGLIAPTDVDPTWSAFGNVQGCAYDQTDGNVIVYCGSSGHTHNDYIVKLDAATAAVIWAYPVNKAPNSTDMAQWQITRQTLYFLGASSTLYTIDTATGTATTQTIGTLTNTGACISEDIYGSFIGYGSWSQSSTVPDYVGTYMGDEGNHALTNQWYRYMPNGAISPPAPPDIPSTGVVSINRAWTYVQDGHTFYVLDLGTQGTFAFDTESQQWSEFQTAGSNFNMLNGGMWGQRVVGGDASTTDVWELDPGAVKDADGLYEIDHVVTGGLNTRSRTYVSCDAVRVTASFGVMGDAGATFNLRFSDDQGNTWSPFFSITLVAGAYDQELAWNSLGSFAAPGRIFEFSDSGGLIRIDGVDVFVNGFDNDGQEQDQGGG